MLDCSGIDDWSALLAALEAAIRAAAQAPRDEDHLVLRPVLHGGTPLSWRLRRDLDRLGEEARAMAAVSGVWIDKIELHTSDPRAGAGAAGAHLPAELVTTLLTELPQDAALMAALQGAARDLLKDLPPELRDIFGADEEEFSETCREMLAEGTPMVLAGLTEEEAK